jgi:hypothetical protein
MDEMTVYLNLVNEIISSCTLSRSENLDYRDVRNHQNLSVFNQLTITALLNDEVYCIRTPVKR